jgi:hypothetical protein
MDLGVDARIVGPGAAFAVTDDADQRCPSVELADERPTWGNIVILKIFLQKKLDKKIVSKYTNLCFGCQRNCHCFAENWSKTPNSLILSVAKQFHTCLK